jgi:valyl-tRNA synthetase
VSGLRSVRAEMNVPPSATAPLVMVGTSTTTSERLVRHDPAIKRLARVTDILLESEAPRGSAQIVVGEATACLPLGDLIDLDAEKARLEKAAAKVAADIDKIERKLGNEKFVANARPEIVEAEREKCQDLHGQQDKLAAAIARLVEAG